MNNLPVSLEASTPAVCMHQLFESQARRTPHSIAAVFEDAVMTYRELDARSNQFARVLKSAGAGPETLVGIYMDHSLEMLVALLGILKAGGAYVPLDPKYPSDRLKLFLEDSRVSLLVAQEKWAGRISDDGLQKFYLGASWARLKDESAEPVDSGANPDNLAYIPYTSGSTGRPKGVEITHRALVNFLRSMSERPGLGPQDTFIALMPLSFDPHAMELLLPLIVGAKILLVDRDLLGDWERLRRVLADCRVTVMQAGPFIWRLLVESGWRGTPGLKILSGCEPLPPELARRLSERGSSVWNLYGLTELAVWSTAFKYEGQGGPIPIGEPIAGTQVFVLDSNLKPVSGGAEGEIYIGGAGLPRGYLRAPELTAQKMIANPFDPANKSRLFRTGDWARCRPDGRIEFVGRIDHQLKFRGFRIEPEEIECALLQHPQIRQAAVTVRHAASGDPRLIAYVAPAVRAVTAEAVRNFLTTQLPDYLMPTDYVLVDSLPRTPSGKLDRHSMRRYSFGSGETFRGA